MDRRRTLLFALRAAASAVMLGLLLTRFDVASLLPARGQSALPWIGAGLAVTLVALVLATVRWQRVLRALELPCRLPTLLSHSLAGLFVANFLPSTVGGDVLRVARLSAANGERPASFASVVLERLTGFFVLPLLTLLALTTHPHLLQLGAATRVALTLSLGTLLLLAVLLTVAASPRLGGRLAHHPGWLRFGGAVHLGLNRLRRHPGAAASMLATALAYQLTVVLSGWLAGRALGIDLGWAAVMAFLPAVAIAQVVPVSVNGLGLREGAFVLFLQPLGVPPAQAVALGLLLYAMNVVVSLLGAPAFAAGPRRLRTA